MNLTIKYSAILALLTSMLYAGELPKEITYGKAKLTNCEVVEWSQDCVTIRHARGVDPLQYRYMDPVARKAYEEARDSFLSEKSKLTAEQGIKQQKAYNEKIAWEAKVKAAIASRSLIVGMTKAEAIAAWGSPHKVNNSVVQNAAHEQWIYGEVETTRSGYQHFTAKRYVYFDNGILTGWN